jgi:uncharacterized membrane protein YdjX (TVP38/TMEM64 family)
MINVNTANPIFINFPVFNKHMLTHRERSTKKRKESSRMHARTKNSTRFLTKKRKHLLKFLLFTFLIIFVIFSVKKYNLSSYLDPKVLRSMIEPFGSLAPLIFIGIYTIATLFFLPGTPITIASGILFGKFLGTFYTIIGATLGATLAFLVTKFLGEEFVEDILKGKFKKLYSYDKKIEENGFLTVLILRLLPLFPFNGLNFAFGLTKVKLKDYILGTALGIIPGTFVLAYLGDSLAEVSIINIIIACMLFILMIFILPIYKKCKKCLEKVKKNENSIHS